MINKLYTIQFPFDFFRSKNYNGQTEVYMVFRSYIDLPIYKNNIRYLFRSTKYILYIYSYMYAICMRLAKKLLFIFHTHGLCITDTPWCIILTIHVLCIIPYLIVV